MRLGTLFTRRSAPPLVALCQVLAASGCEPLGPPEQFPTTPVSGVVREGGRPVGGGWIEFIPVDGTVGDQRSAPLAADGGFRDDHVPIGEVALRLVNAPIQMPRGAGLFGQFATPIRRTISAGATPPLQVELVDEAVRFQARQPQRTRIDFDQEPTGTGNGAGGAR
jgi:hypothetical protein